MEIALWGVAGVAGAAVLAAVLAFGGRAGLMYLTFYRRPKGHPGSFTRRPDDGAVVVCAGDSLTHATVSGDYVARLRRRLPSTRFVNAGRNGDTAEGLLGRLGEILACEPTDVVILIGTNDVRRSRPHAAFAADVAAILTRLTPAARVALLSIPPQGDRPDDPVNDVVASYNLLLADLADEHGAGYVPVHERLAALAADDAGTDRPATTGVSSYLRLTAWHLLARRSWDSLAARRGSTVLVDGVHLSDRAADEVADLVAERLGRAALQRGFTGTGEGGPHTSDRGGRHDGS
ncbi:SGNH/GDSL hydrolase family protein [Actinomadura gamaensis]|uniref:SGNH/GDSL hydrolase family protein n=1 Tax=Actinomadura gamaensis TaxID=1763541 RepID=A0ABV9TW79_9ACTN